MRHASERKAGTDTALIHLKIGNPEAITKVKAQKGLISKLSRNTNAEQSRQKMDHHFSGIQKFFHNRQIRRRFGNRDQFHVIHLANGITIWASSVWYAQYQTHT